jgi:threonine synthase
MFPVIGLISKAFADTFDHEDIIPVKKVGDVYVAELWHGPTLAFKDLAQQCVGQMIEYFTSKSSRRVTLLVSTSGDTGSAAIESVRRLQNVDIICMFPMGGCSNVQELQMTTILDDNVHVLASEGSSFDNDVVLQSILKNPEVAKMYQLGTINSFMWARPMMQIVHYFYCYLQVCSNPGEEVEFIVPTGGAGNLTGK